ncbi:Ribosome biogenesis protein nsa1 (NOP7-associated protein 1) [Sorochytrium milnesiophthora]
MHIFTGDEAGLLKCVPIAKSQYQAGKLQQTKRALQPTEPKARQVNEKLRTDANAVVQSFGRVDKLSAVQMMVSTAEVSPDGTERLVIARGNGVVQVWNPFQKSTDRALQMFAPGATTTNNKKMSFVGLCASQGTLVTCTSAGVLSFTTMTAMHSLPLGPNIRRVRTHPLHPHLIAYGGVERDLVVMDVNAPHAVADRGEMRFAGLDAPSHWDGEPPRNSMMWKAKNVKHDKLNLRTPVDIADIQFMSDDGTRIAVGTGQHQIRLYDTRTARRPVVDLEVGSYPIRCLAAVPGKNEVIAADTTGCIVHYCLTTRQKIGGYQGAVGSVRDLCVFESGGSGRDGSTTPRLAVAAVGLDRFLRTWDVATHEPMEKWYLKQRLECVTVVQGDVNGTDGKESAANGDDDDDNEEAAGEDVWDSIDVVNDGAEDNSATRKKRDAKDDQKKKKQTKRSAGAASAGDGSKKTKRSKNVD